MGNSNIVRSKMEEEKFDFEKLDVYQKALDYIDFVCCLLGSFLR